jgi:hypothetical protein
MAKDVKFNITAVDRTKNAFKSVLGGLKKVSGALLNFKTAIAGAVGVAGLGLLIKRSLEATDRIGKLSSVLGFSVKELQTFKLASQIGGVELETFSKGVRRLVDNFGDFMDGTGEAKKTFEALGISVEEANKLSGDQFAILGLVADRLNLVTNSTDKLKFAIEIFGGRGAELINVLKGGSEAIAEFQRQSEQFGALNEEQVKQVEDLNDSIVRLKTSFANITNQVVANLSPALTSLIDDFNQSLSATDDGGSRITEVSRSISLAIVRGVKSSLKALGELVAGFENTLLKIKLFERNPFFFFTNDIQNLEDLTNELEIQKALLQKAKDEGGFVERDGQTLLPAKFEEDVIRLEEFIEELKQAGHTIGSPFEKSLLILDQVEQKVITGGQALKQLSEIGENDVIKISDSIIVTDQNVNTLNGSLEELHDQFRETFQLSTLEQFKIKISDLKVGAFDVLIATTEQLSGMFAKTFTDAIFGVKSLKDGMRELARNVVMQLIQGLIQIGLQVFVFDPLLKKIRSMADEEKKVNEQLKQQILLRLILMAFGGGRSSGGNVEGSSGGRASGGYVQGSRPMGGATGYGKAYMVGERGAELFVPDQDGTIIPNDKLGTTNNVNITIMANDTEGFDDLLIKRRSTIINVINDALNTQGREALV